LSKYDTALPLTTFFTCGCYLFKTGHVIVSGEIEVLLHLLVLLFMP